MDGKENKGSKPVSLLNESHRLLISGGIAGCTAKTVTAPLSRLAILFQVHSMLTTKPQSPQYASGLLPAVRKVIGKEGVFAFWKGNLTSVVHRFPYSAFNFFAFESLKEHTRVVLGNEHDTMSSRFIAGALAGGLATTLCYPLDLVRTRLTTQIPSSLHYKGIVHALTRITQEEGILGLYHGLGSTLVCQVPNLAIGYSVYGFLRDRVMGIVDSSALPPTSAQSTANSSTCQHCSRPFEILEPVDPEPEPWLPGPEMAEHSSHEHTGEVCTCDREAMPLSHLLVNMGCGALSGIASTLVIYPLDVVRRRMQLQSLHRDRSHIHGPLSELTLIVRHEGIHGLYRGLTPELLKVIPTVGITFCTYEYMKTWFRV